MQSFRARTNLHVFHASDKDNMLLLFLYRCVDNSTLKEKLNLQTGNILKAQTMYILCHFAKLANCKIVISISLYNRHSYHRKRGCDLF